MATKQLKSLKFGADTYTVPAPVSKTSAMTQPVGVDSDGKLYTAPSGTGGGTTSGGVPVSQGTNKAGQFLVVGSDGNVTTMTLATWQGGSY